MTDTTTPPPSKHVPRLRYFAGAVGLVFVAFGLGAMSSPTVHTDALEPGVVVGWIGSCLLCLCFGRWASNKRQVNAAVAAATGGDAEARAAANASPHQYVVIGGRHDEAAGTVIYDHVGEYDHVIARGADHDGRILEHNDRVDDHARAALNGGTHNHFDLDDYDGARPVTATVADGRRGDRVRVDRDHRSGVDHGRRVGAGWPDVPRSEVVK